MITRRAMVLSSTTSVRFFRFCGRGEDMGVRGLCCKPDGKPEFRAFTHPAGNTYFASHQFNQLLCDRESQASATVLARGRRAACVNLSNRQLDCIIGDTDARVGDNKAQHFYLLYFHDVGYPYPGSRQTRTTTSPWEVNLMALPTRFVSTWRRRPGSPRSSAGTSPVRHDSPAVKPLIVCAERHAGDEVVKHARKVDRSKCQARTLMSRLDLRKIQDVVDQAQQVRRRSCARSSAHCRLLRPRAVPAQQLGHAHEPRSWACESRGSYSPGTRSWPRWPARPRLPSG